MSGVAKLIFVGFVQVLVFAERTGDVDNILESLITSGVEAVAVHGGLDQQDREYAISSFKVCNTPPLFPPAPRPLLFTILLVLPSYIDQSTML